MTVLRSGLRAAQANILPALMLQTLAIGILVGYYRIPQAHAGLEHLATLKERVGWPFVFGASALAGALLPFALQTLQRGGHRRVALGALPFFVVFWGLRGLVVNGFYELQSVLWGDNAHLTTIIAKICLDMLVASPLLFIPSIVWAFAFADAGFRWQPFVRAFEPGWYGRKVVPLVCMAWMVWVPAVAVIYALPQGLQFPVQAIIQCFWALLLVVLTDSGQ